MSEISVLTPIYNGARNLNRFREQLESQTRTPDQILVYDDGSTDGTRAALEQWASIDSRVRVIGGDRNRGRGVARQRLLEAATSEFTAWLDVDDCWHPRTLEVRYSEYRTAEAEQGGPFLICSPYYQVSLRNGGERFVSLPRTYCVDDYLRLARDKNSVAMLQCAFGRTADYASVGFDESLNWSEDFEFFLHFMAKGGRLVPQVDPSVAVGYFHTMVGRDMGAVVHAHDYVYAKHRGLWRTPREATIEKYTRRLRYVLYGCMVSNDGDKAECIFFDALEQLGADAREADIRMGVRSVLKAYQGDASNYLAFAHAWANRTKRLQCSLEVGGYRLTSTRTGKVRWRTADGTNLEGDLLREDYLETLFLSGVRNVTGLERLDGGSAREFRVKALPGGTIGLVPKVVTELL